MPRNSAGTYTLPESAFVSNTPISSSAMNSDLSDIATALTASLARTGEGGMSAVLNLAFAGFAYTSDPDTGMSRSALNTQVISCGGQDWTVTETDFTAPDGTSVLPLVGEIRMWALPTAPAGWIFMLGQACTTANPLWRAALIAAGNPYGTSGGDPLFPNMQTAVPAGRDVNRGGLSGSGTLGAFIGNQSATLSIANLPTFTPGGSISQITPAGSVTSTPSFGNILNASGVGGSANVTGGGGAYNTGTLSVTSSFSGTPVTPTFTGTPIGSGTGHDNVQPTIILNFIGRDA